MKKILAILALMIMVSVLASCNGDKEGSKSEEKGENAQIEAAEQATPTTENIEAPVAAPVK